MLVEPSDISRFVFDDHVTHYGEPEFHFALGKDSLQALDYLDVFVWEPTSEIPMTTFSTMGMCERKQFQKNYSVEIHWTIRGFLTADAKQACTEFLARLAEWPFLKNISYDYWSILPNLQVPGFPNCSGILFHPALVDGAWDHTHFGLEEIRILNMIPIAESELQMAQTLGVRGMLNYLYDSKTDIFSDRV